MELTNLVSLIFKQIHISSYIKKDIRGKILTNNPIPHNVKETQKLDEYIKERLSVNKKLSKLNQEKTLKGTQEKVG